MLSKLIKQKIHDRFGKEIRYPKDCESLAEHISNECRTRLSASTLRRLYGFVKNIKEPRMHTLDILAEYLGHKSWEQFLASMDKAKEEPVKVLERLKLVEIKNGQTIQLDYAPNKQVSIKRIGTSYRIVTSNEKKILLNDEVEFRIIELHYPLTFTHVMREGKSIGKVQVATVSGITAITRG